MNTILGLLAVVLLGGILWSLGETRQYLKEILEILKRDDIQ